MKHLLVLTDPELSYEAISCWIVDFPGNRKEFLTYYYETLKVLILHFAKEEDPCELETKDLIKALITKIKEKYQVEVAEELILVPSYTIQHEPPLPFDALIWETLIGRELDLDFAKVFVDPNELAKVKTK